MPGHSTKEISGCKSVTNKVQIKNKTLILEKGRPIDIIGLKIMNSNYIHCERIISVQELSVEWTT